MRKGRMKNVEGEWEWEWGVVAGGGRGRVLDENP